MSAMTMGGNYGFRLEKIDVFDCVFEITCMAKIYQGTWVDRIACTRRPSPPIFQSDVNNVVLRTLVRW